jgi:hypothetical protein
MAAAPFDPRPRSVPLDLRGSTIDGVRLTQRAGSLLVHVAVRVFSDEQWARGTTTREFIEDLRAAVRYPSARLVIYGARGGYVAGILVPNVVPGDRRGPKALPLLFVVYAADRGTIVSGYQVSGESAIRLGGDARWLR